MLGTPDATDSCAANSAGGVAMSKLRIATQSFALPMLVTFLWGAPPATTVIQKPSITPVRDPKIPQLQRISAISPLRFEPNVGQAGPEVRYIARGSGYMLLLAGQEAVMVLPSDSSSPSQVRMKLVGAASTSASQPENLLPSVSHYYIGNDPKQVASERCHCRNSNSRVF